MLNFHHLSFTEKTIIRKDPISFVLWEMSFVRKGLYAYVWWDLDVRVQIGEQTYTNLDFTILLMLMISGVQDPAFLIM